MNNTSYSENRGFRFSEEAMADAFQQLLSSKNGLPEIGAFDGIYREISCQQGRPDFIALRNNSNHNAPSFPKAVGLVGPSILSNLKPNSPRTLDYIVSHSEFSRDSIRRCLRRFLDSGHVEETDSGSFCLGKSAVGIQSEIWSFELKLDNAKRAVFQAKQSRAFAERAIIVIPPGKEHSYDKYHETLRRWGIGLATFDPMTKDFRFVKKGRKAKAFSRTHQIYALSRIQLGQ
jgi:hypothetical protein